MLRCKSLLAAVALMLIVSLASAQEQPRGRGRGGFGGGRGFGGPGGGMFNSPVALLGMPEVRKELNTTEEQNKQIDDVVEEMRESTRGAFGNFQELQNLSDEERQKRMDEMRKKGEDANKAAEDKINKVLKPEQLTRLKQLSLQRQGIYALTRPEVAKQLGLTQEQQDKIQKVQEAARPQGPPPANFQDQTEEEREKARTQARERQEKVQTDVLAVLTDDQKSKFAELKGKAFDFPPMQFGGGGFGGRPGGPGGAGGERRRPATKQRDE